MQRGRFRFRLINIIYQCQDILISDKNIFVIYFHNIIIILIESFNYFMHKRCENKIYIYIYTYIYALMLNKRICCNVTSYDHYDAI